jgi:hypothetical protein
MKNIKLKYFALSLMMILQWSCATNEPLIDAKNTNNSQFDIDTKMSYAVDGKVTGDLELIKNAQKKAWNVHFDYSTNKVVISTTELEYNNYLNSDKEYNARLEGNVIESQKAEANNSLRVNSTAATSGIYDKINYPNHLLFVVASYVKVSGKDRLFHFFFIGPWNNTAYSSSKYCIRDDNNGALDTELFNPNGYKMFSPQAERTDAEYTFMRNTSNVSKTMTFYEKSGYQAPSRSITLSKHSHQRVYYSQVSSNDRRPQSFR